MYIKIFKLGNIFKNTFNSLHQRFTDISGIAGLLPVGTHFRGIKLSGICHVVWTKLCLTLDAKVDCSFVSTF